MVDLRQKINDSRDAWLVIEARKRDRPGRYHGDCDCFPKDFKLVRIPKYDGKQDPRQWLCCYSVTIEVSGGSNSTKALYFPVALEPAPLTWLESLTPNSFELRDDLKRAFIDNF
jgi:hypothetical protein